jgi:hypothetical protein
MEITRKEWEEVTRLIKLKIVDTSDVGSMESIIKKWIDKHMSICRHCPAQIRMAHRRLTNWYNRNQFDIIEDDATIAETTAEETKDITTEQDTKETIETKPSKKRGRPCTKCKEKKNGSPKKN